MLDIIFQILGYTKTLFIFSFFTYIYKYFYDSCNEKKIIKSKNEKPKKVIKSRIVLSFIYLIILTLLYFSLTWYIFFTLFLTILISGILFLHKFEPKAIDVLKQYDSLPILKKVWFVYSKIMTIIFKLFSPCHRVIENKINKNKEIIKDNIFNQFGKLNFGENLGVLGSLSEMKDNNSKSKTESNFSNISNYFKNQNDKKNTESKSDLNKYLVTEIKNKDTKKEKTKEIVKENNESFNIDSVTDIDEPLDALLLKNSSNKKTSTIDDSDEKLSIEEFVNNITNINDKMSSKIVTNNDKEDIMNFISNNNIFSDVKSS